MKFNASHQPDTLYRASLERMQAAWKLIGANQHDWAVVEAMYLAGLAIEALLQAFALKYGAKHDARHDLLHWLSKCPDSLQQSLNQPIIRDAVSTVTAEWRNAMRYWDYDALLGHARKQARWRGIKGDDPQRVRSFVMTFLENADRLHQKGTTLW